MEMAKVIMRYFCFVQGTAVAVITHPCTGMLELFIMSWPGRLHAAMIVHTAPTIPSVKLLDS